MKTLDEMIKALEYCISLDGCANCPFFEKPDCGVRDDALVYLRGYREVLPEYAQMKLDAVTNDPITWQELTQMIGKPVWDEGKTVKHWTIITGIYYDDLNEGYVLLTYYSERNGAQTIRRKRSTMGKTWNAYRKEREQ